ncbi:porin family protein [Barnesiella viscericola]|uniref:porin family protein n=1 Tax=Barnesiella viscericola TaxID=397865 RepID=UPI002357A65C|nr:porin family protein [Barnesiella viscericola]
MKKTIFCVALVATLFLAIPANAQFKFGPKVGMNISSLSLGGDLSDNFKSSNVTSFTGGLMAEFMVPVIGVGVDASVMYTRKGSDLKNLVDNSTEKQHTDYVEIPINLKYKFSLPVVGSVLAPFIYAGPSFAFRVGDNFAEQYKAKSFETAINVGVGVELFNHLQIAGQYGWGLGKTMEVESNVLNSALNGKSRAWTVTAAYLF